jgi:Rrf2 family nitric oxide-sensitive transcriptional repressor
MQLSYYTDYAFRILMLAGSLPPDKLGQIRPTATQLGLPENHVRKIVHELGVEGYLINKPGKNGGFSLAYSAADINLAAVVRFCETNLALVECFREEQGDCSIIKVCQLQKVLGKALSAFLSVLGDYSLEDILNKKVQQSLQPI